MNEENKKPYNKTHRVFVYGTLKKGLGNHNFLKNSTFIGEDRTQENLFEMRAMGSIPFVVQTNNLSFSISGELYEVTNQVLRELDILEGNGMFYTRKLVWLENNYEEQAWMYIGDDNFPKVPLAGYDNIDLKDIKDSYVQTWKIPEQKTYYPFSSSDSFKHSSSKETSVSNSYDSESYKKEMKDMKTWYLGLMTDEELEEIRKSNLDKEDEDEIERIRVSVMEEDDGDELQKQFHHSFLIETDPSNLQVNSNASIDDRFPNTLEEYEEG